MLMQLNKQEYCKKAFNFFCCKHCDFVNIAITLLIQQPNYMKEYKIDVMPKIGFAANLQNV